MCKQTYEICRDIVTTDKNVGMLFRIAKRHSKSFTLVALGMAMTQIVAYMNARDIAVLQSDIRTLKKEVSELKKSKGD